MKGQWSMKSVVLASALLFVSFSALHAQTPTRAPEAYAWGAPGDLPVAGDFDGDKIQDIAVYRPSSGTWYIRLSSLQFSIYQTVAIRWGQAGDVPMPGDYNGDGITDVAVFRPSTGVWYITFSSAR